MTDWTLPALVISLDFELRWGVHDLFGTNMDGYRKNLEKSREVVPALLKLFSERKLRVTWASVGALGCRNWNDYFLRSPKPPCYHNPALAISPRYAELDPQGDLHFAPELLDAIYQTPGQELGTHTFSHIYMREPGVTAEDVLADLSAVSKMWEEKFGFLPRSLVFPRNQHAFLSLIRSSSIRIWRGNPGPWYYECNDSASNTLLSRALRLSDDLNPMVRRSALLEGDMSRASLFLRANLPGPAWNLHLARIRREIVTLRPGHLFHIWWHPHNLGAKMPMRLSRIEKVLDLAAERCEKKLLASYSMGDLATFQ